MNPYAAVALLGLIAIVESTVLTRIDVSGLHPNLMLLTVTAWSLLRGSRVGVAWGFVGGLALDLLSGGPLGLNTILMSVAGYLAGLGEARIFRTNYVLPILIISGLTVGYFAVQFIVLQFTDRALPLGETAWRVAAPTLALNLLASPLVFGPLRWLSRRTGREQLRW